MFLVVLQRSFTLILQAYDDAEYSGGSESGLILETWWSGIVEPGGEWHLLRGEGAGGRGEGAGAGGERPASSVAYRVRVACAQNYYSATCTRFCRARDDPFGHYGCDAKGDKRCLEGWRGDNCDIRTYPHSHALTPLSTISELNRRF